MLVQQNKVVLIRSYLSTAVIIIATLVLCGWLFNLPVLKSILSGYIAMNPLTAVNFILIASGILLVKKETAFNILILRIIAFLVIAIMLLKVADFLFLTHFNPDKILFASSLGVNKMAEPTIFNFIFLAVALFLSSRKKD